MKAQVPIMRKKCTKRYHKQDAVSTKANVLTDSIVRAPQHLMISNDH